MDPLPTLHLNPTLEFVWQVGRYSHQRNSESSNTASFLKVKLVTRCARNIGFGSKHRLNNFMFQSASCRSALE